MATLNPTDFPRTSGVYCLTNTVNGKMYIGSSLVLRKRISAHFERLRSGKHHSRHLQAGWDKYGDVFVATVMVILEPELLLSTESGLIKRIGLENLYNKRLDAASNIGVSVSEETRRKLSQRLKGRQASAVTKERMSAWQRGRKLPPEWCENIRRGKLGNKQRLGKFHNTETRERMSRTKSSTPYRFVSPDGIIFEGIGVTPFSRAHGLQEQNMRRVLSGKYEQHKGWRKM